MSKLVKIYKKVSANFLYIGIYCISKMCYNIYKSKRL